jgi:hypothetical protein
MILDKKKSNSPEKNVKVVSEYNRVNIRKHIKKGKLFKEPTLVPNYIRNNPFVE